MLYMQFILIFLINVLQNKLFRNSKLKSLKFLTLSDFNRLNRELFKFDLLSPFLIQSSVLFPVPHRITLLQNLTSINIGIRYISSIFNLRRFLMNYEKYKTEPNPTPNIDLYVTGLRTSRNFFPSNKRCGVPCNYPDELSYLGDTPPKHTPPLTNKH